MEKQEIQKNELESAFYNLASDTIQLIEEKWSGIDWQRETPRMGRQFYYQEINALDSFKEIIILLTCLKSPNSNSPDYSLEKPALTFVEAILGSYDGSSSDIEQISGFWFDRLWEFLQSEKAHIRLLIGVMNIEADEGEIVIDPETRLICFGQNNFKTELGKFVQLWNGGDWNDSLSSLRNCEAAVVIDFKLPALQVNEGHLNYSNECINKLVIVRNALHLCGFGLINVSPWISILNPAFPIDGVHPIGDRRPQFIFGAPKLVVDKPCIERLINAFNLLNAMEAEEKDEIDQYRAVRRRFKLMVSRFATTFDQGVWPSAVVDLTIVMESLLTPTRGGGKTPLALAASNLLGTSEQEIKEVFENVSRMYTIRNEEVHGDPGTQQQWEIKLDSIARDAGFIDNWEEYEGQKKYRYAIEVLRDYARRSILAMLNLFIEFKRSPSGNLGRELQKSHFNPGLKAEIQQQAKIYPIIKRQVHWDES